MFLRTIFQRKIGAVKITKKFNDFLEMSKNENVFKTYFLQLLWIYFNYLI